MSHYRIYGVAAGAVVIAGVTAYSAADRSMNYKPAKASVFMIDRMCDIIETTTSSDGQKTSRTYNDNCKSIGAWEKASAAHDKSIAGKATVKVSYTAPQNGSYQTSELHFTSRDDEFYDLQAGDQIDVLVSNDDPSKIHKA
jgi:hypothetical protein